MLHSRDPHQLFELLCIQVKAISCAYFENLHNMCFMKLDGSGQEIFGDVNACEWPLFASFDTNNPNSPLPFQL